MINRREFFKVCGLIAAGALGIVRLPKLTPLDKIVEKVKSMKWTTVPPDAITLARYREILWSCEGGVTYRNTNAEPMWVELKKWDDGPIESISKVESVDFCGDWDGGLYTVPWPWWTPSLPSGEFQGLHKLINTGHAEGGHKIAE